MQCFLEEILVYSFYLLEPAILSQFQNDLNTTYFGVNQDVLGWKRNASVIRMTPNLMTEFHRNLSSEVKLNWSQRNMDLCFQVPNCLLCDSNVCFSCKRNYYLANNTCTYCSFPKLVVNDSCIDPDLHYQLFYQESPDTLMNHIFDIFQPKVN